MKKFILLMLAFMLAACTSAGSSEYDKNLDKWKDASIAHYRYSLFIGCFCPFMEEMPITIEVNNGEIVSMTSAKGPIDATNPLKEVADRYSTIDRVFLALKADLTGDADDVVVEYDSVYGFPSNVAVDNIKEAMDDEISYQVSDFEILK
jgi:hypothetical protein